MVTLSPAVRLSFVLFGLSCASTNGLQVFIVTGGYTGVGAELCKILYTHNATVYMAGRSASKAEKALASIKNASPTSKGRIEFLHLDLSDLSTIKPAVNSFSAQQQRLDGLVNNAAVCPLPFLILVMTSLV